MSCSPPCANPCEPGTKLVSTCPRWYQIFTQEKHVCVPTNYEGTDDVTGNILTDRTTPSASEDPIYYQLDYSESPLCPLVSCWFGFCSKDDKYDNDGSCADNELGGVEVGSKYECCKEPGFATAGRKCHSGKGDYEIRFCRTSAVYLSFPLYPDVYESNEDYRCPSLSTLTSFTLSNPEQPVCNWCGSDGANEYCYKNFYMRKDGSCKELNGDTVFPAPSADDDENGGAIAFQSSVGGSTAPNQGEGFPAVLTIGIVAVVGLLVTGLVMKMKKRLKPSHLSGETPSPTIDIEMES